MSDQSQQSNERAPEQRVDRSLLLPIAEAARLLGVSRMTITRRIKSGAWPSGRCGRKHLVPRAFVNGAVAAIEAGRGVDVDEFAAAWFARAEGAA